MAHEAAAILIPRQLCRGTWNQVMWMLVPVCWAQGSATSCQTGKKRSDVQVPPPPSSLGEVTQMALAFVERSSLRAVWSACSGCDSGLWAEPRRAPMRVGPRGREVPQVMFPDVAAGMQWRLRPALVCAVLWPVSSRLELGLRFHLPCVPCVLLAPRGADRPSSPTREP